MKKITKLTKGQEQFNDFLDAFSKEKEIYDFRLTAPPMSNSQALAILIEHFAPNYISTMPVTQFQYNTEVVHYILSTYKGRKV